MSELYEIESKYRALELDDYEAENTWSGKIIVEEDGWFEGIIREKTEEDVDIFVFGIYLPESRIEVHTISPYIDRRATVYNGRKSLDTFFPIPTTMLVPRAATPAPTFLAFFIASSFCSFL